MVDALQALRGVQCIAAMTLVADMGELTRCDTPRERRQFLGLLPSESSSGEQRRQGASTQAGHTHARHVLVAGAWACREPAKARRQLQRRRDTPPKMLQDSSWKAQVRRCQRYRQLAARGNHPNVVTVAMARELMGFLGAMAKRGLITLSSQDAWRLTSH